METEFGSFVEHHLPCGSAVVGDDAVEDGVLNGVLDDSNLVAGGEVEGLHDVDAADRGLEVADAVAFFEFDEFLPYKLEVLHVAAHFLLVLAGDVGLAKGHEVVDVVASVEEETADGGVGDLVFGQDDGPQVEQDEFFDVFHLRSEGETQAGEDFLHHVASLHFVAVEGPS